MLELFHKLYNFYMIKRQLKRSHYAAIMLRNSIKYGDCVEEKIYFRPNEVHSLIGDYSKAKKILNWRPKINFDKLISEMVDEDLKLIK